MTKQKPNVHLSWLPVVSSPPHFAVPSPLVPSPSAYKRVILRCFRQLNIHFYRYMYRTPSKQLHVWPMRCLLSLAMDQHLGHDLPCTC
jgi:hypothetical protein